MMLKRQIPETRQKRLTVLNTSYLKKPLIKNKIKGLINSAGRNNTGKITVHHRGGGHKKKYRKVEFLREKEFTGIVMRIEYDPNRSANIASLCAYSPKTPTYMYIIAPKNLKTGDIVKTGLNLEAKLGNSLPISEIPVGTCIYNISTKLKTPGKISRSAGTFSKLKEKLYNDAKLELSSGKHISISTQCFASVGIVSNEIKNLTQKFKAGKSRWLNKRPTVRGVAMNPVDHPHGGGEGKKSGKGKTPWGKPVKNGKTGKNQNKQL